MYTYNYLKLVASYANNVYLSINCRVDLFLIIVRVLSGNVSKQDKIIWAMFNNYSK